MKIIVLMSTYNGEKYIRQQLDSVINQDLKLYKILIRDDGSSDNTINILEEYASKYSFIEYYCDNNLGPAKSFFNLINRCEKADYYALCDQDDIWFVDKLSSAVNLLKQQDDEMPLLYAGRFILTDENLNPLKSDISKLYSFTDFAHSLIYHTAPGCTFVFNDKAKELVKMYDVDREYIVIHDAIIHKVVTMFGKMILDETPHMYYRQHKSNAIGLTADRFKEFVNRVNNVLTGKLKNYRSNTAKSLLNVYGDMCEDNKKELLNIVANYKEIKDLKHLLLTERCFRTNTKNDYFFKILVISNYI